MAETGLFSCYSLSEGEPGASVGLQCDSREIRYQAVFNRLAHGPAGVELWNEIITHINNIALEERATLDTIESGWGPVP